MAKWIWKFGEFEVYHNLLVHNRRQQYGYPEPAVWKLYAPEPVVSFRRRFVSDGGNIELCSCGNASTSIIDAEGRESKYGGQHIIELPKGEISLIIRVANTESFPCLLVKGAVESDGDWEADDFSQNWAQVGFSEFFTEPGQKPERFPFVYEKLEPLDSEKLPDGILFDFGKETFAKTEFSGLKDDTVRIRFGESREEALDEKWCVIRFEDKPENGTLSYPPYAFRYIFVSDENARISSEYEYLPMKNRGAFRCNEEVINRVWDTAAYTFHLNCREFFLDGIKRDRWVWSADAYQSMFVNHYLFFDQEIEKRTLIALGGKSPFKVHINTIMDYTFFWIISVYEYYLTYGDKKLLEQLMPQLQEVMNFCLGRTDEDGFMRGKPGDWVFIDWAEMDKTGALCGEQILYAKALKSYSDICALLGKDDMNCGEKSKVLQLSINEKFYDTELGAFIDSYESGKRNISRQSNILAYLFLPCSEDQKENIYRNVVLNDAVTQITTPYFKFYEYQVYCMAGSSKLLEESIRSYYGSMLETGATTLYEEYDPRLTGAEHYAMYGHPYEKSLCHAWSASPIYLLGAYRMGVRNTGVAYSSFEVRPALGDLKEFTGKVPVPGGYVSVSMNEHEVKVLSDIPGGTLFLGGKSYILKPGEELRIEN